MSNNVMMKKEPELRNMKMLSDGQLMRRLKLLFDRYGIAL
jgi:hypothetical protein